MRKGALLLLVFLCVPSVSLGAGVPSPGYKVMKGMEGYLASLRARFVRLCRGGGDGLVAFLPSLNNLDRDIEVHQVSSRIYSPAWNLILQGDLNQSLLGGGWGGLVDLALPLGLGGHRERVYKREWEASMGRLLKAAPPPKDYGPLLIEAKRLYLTLIAWKKGLVREKVSFLRDAITLLKTISKEDLFYRAIYQRLEGDVVLEEKKLELFKGLPLPRARDLPLLFINVERLERVLKEREEKLRKELDEAITVKEKEGVLRHIDADLYTRYRFSFDGSQERWVWGIRVKFPLPLKSKEKNKADYLKLLSMKEVVHRVFKEREMEVLDRAWSVNRSTEFILQHLTILHRSLYRAQKDLAFWKVGSSEVDHLDLIENLLNAYYRLEVIGVYQERAYKDLLELYLLLQPMEAEDFVKLILDRGEAMLLRNGNDL